MSHDIDIADDLDALASSIAPVDSWDEVQAQDSHLDLVALAASTSSAPPTSSADVRSARRRAPLLALVAGLGIGFGFASLVFGASAEVASASAAPVATRRIEAPSPPSAPSPTSAAGEVLDTAVSAPVFATSEPAPGELAGRTVVARASPLHREVSTSSPRPSAASGGPLPPAPTETAVVEPRPDPTPTVAPSVTSERDVDTLLDEATFPMAGRPESAQRSELLHPEVVPLIPSRAQVEEVLETLRSAVRGCAMGQSGLATADVVVRSDGTVVGVRVTGAPFEGTATGRCMQGVVRPARFPRFTRPTLHVRFPFAIP